MSWSGEPAPSRALPNPAWFGFMVFAGPNNAFVALPIFASTGEVFEGDEPGRVTAGCG